jgi:lysylphosphatidylglycerol synthetase-like protein (DUF2156 family)
MSNIVSSIKKHLTWERWQLLYIVTSLSWMLGPAHNPAVLPHMSFISEYEDPGQPWSWLYLACDMTAAVLLGLAIAAQVRRWRRTGRQAERWQVYSVVLLGIIAAGSFIDAAFPSHCHGGLECALAPDAVTGAVHAVESVITTGAFFALNLLWVARKMPWARAVLVAQAAWIVIFIVNRFLGHGSNITLAQFTYEIVIILWIAASLPKIAAGRRDSAPGHQSKALTSVHVITAWISVGGLLTIMNAVYNLREISHLSAAYFGDNTAWLSQHAVVVGIILLYISRHLWRGEYRAWQLALVLLWVEAVKYAVLSPNAPLVVLYGATAALLFVQRGAFDRMTSTEVLRERLQRLLIVLAVVLAALCAGVIAFRFKHHQDLDSLRINPVRLARHLFLFDMVNDLGPLYRRLLGQVLNVAGLALLLTVLVSLFKPQKPLLKSDNEHARRELLSLLETSANSGEDFFKYWPRPKDYRQAAGGRAMIAYRLIGNVAFALADPVAQSGSDRAQAAREFLAYCRRHGWLACFLMVADGHQSPYKAAGYKLFRIGASAEVDIATFANKTARNKWWRWVLNKTRKQQWRYEVAVPPHSRARLSALRQVSDAWLQRQKHVERGFALGYFDEAYLQRCRLHLLRDGDEIIAFANELPVFNNLPTATIDLMRFRPDRDHAMPALLAQTIQQLHREGQRLTFDLGFVPLASPTDRTEQVIKILGQLLISETVSAQGLEQFKNKFGPTWVNNYIAFDGDWIDLLSISRQLDKLLQV